MQQLNIDQVRELDSKVVSLYDIKTLAQAIGGKENKGWACLSKEGNFLSQAQAPTLYNSLVEKLESAEQEPTFTSIEGIQTAERYKPRNIVFYNGWYYYVQNGSNAIKRTQDWVTTETVTTGIFNYSNMILCNDNLVFIGSSSFLVYNITRNELSSVINTTFNTDAEGYSVIENILYFGSRNGWGYISFDDLNDFTNLENNLHVHDSTTKRPCFKCGNIWYSFDTYNLKYGNSFNNISTNTSTSVDRPLCCVKVDDYYLVFGGSGQDNNHKTYKVEENGTITKMRNNSLSYPQANKVVYYKGILFEADSYTSHYSTDLGISWTSIPNEKVGRYATVVLANSFCAYIDMDGRIRQIGTKAKQHTDTYTINGSTVTIDFAKAQDGTKIITDLTQTSEISAVKSFLGYFNYFVLDTTNEQVGLPFNSNLWTMMYVGDNYIETSFPDGNATRLLPQAEIITVSSATPSFTSTDKLKTNADYQCGTITALTLDTSSVDDSQLETTIRFTAGASFAFSYTNAGVKINGEIPTFEQGGEYIILVINKTIFVSDKIVAGV